MSLQAVKTLRQIRDLLKVSGNQTTQELFWTRHALGINDTIEAKPFPSGFRYTFLTGTIYHTTGTNTVFQIFKSDEALMPIFCQIIWAAENTGIHELDLKGGNLIVDNQHVVSYTGAAPIRGVIQWLRTPY